MMTVEEAIRQLRTDPRHASLIHDAYLDSDVRESGERFLASEEFAEVRALLGSRLHDARVLDLGAGTGISSYALAKSGAKVVYALEPDPSDEIGRGAIHRLSAGLAIETVAALGENIPLQDGRVDIVYTRQVLHHVRDLPRLLRECARVLTHGGIFLACREHVADNEHQLAAFLRKHPVHKLAGGENAYPLAIYLGAIRMAGLDLKQVFGPWETVINAFPIARSRSELDHVPRVLLQGKLGRIGAAASRLPGTNALVWALLKRPRPGRMYSFVAEKPLMPE